MNDGEGFQVVAGDLHTHAVTVDGVAAEIRTAAQAAEAIEFDANAYGELLTKLGKPARFRVYGTRDGVRLKVVVEPGG